MNDKKRMTEGTPEELENNLMPRVETAGIVDETNIEKVNEVVFELYKEALSVVNLAAHLLDDAANAKGGFPRNQAICAGLMVRICKFMLVVTQLSAKRDRADVVFALNRSILESAVNSEFLLTKNDDAVFEQFVKFSLGPERELYDIIQTNITGRGGEVLPIEKRMLGSINRVCQVSGAKIEEVNHKYGDWGGGVRERLKALKKEEQYVAVQRLPSHAVHGTWVDLCMRHLEYDAEASVFRPDNSFAHVDARLLGPIATFVLQPTKLYLERFFSHVPATAMLLERIADLQNRIIEADAIHDKLMAQEN
ncbi:MAG: DUF5677 domain-containing protein [Candidatus Acidiferrum sp.]